MKYLRYIFTSVLLFVYTSIPIHANTIYITFYDDEGKLISNQELSYGNEIAIPTALKEGYNFLGFNTNIDGSGEYLTTDLALTSQTYYAIYEILVHNVYYYLDGELFHIENVEYGKDAPYIEVPKKEGYVFHGWTGVQEIKATKSLYASYEKESVEVIIVNEPKEVIEKPSVAKIPNLRLILKDENSNSIVNTKITKQDTNNQTQIVSTPTKVIKKDSWLFEILIFIVSYPVVYLIIKKMNFFKNK